MQVLAHEPKGDVLHSLRQLSGDPAEALQVWTRLLGCKHHFAENDSAAPETLKKMIEAREQFWLFGDVGVVWFDAWQPGDAHIHAVFWDQRLRGREKAGAAMMEQLAALYNVHTIWTSILAEYRITLAFARRCGFREFARSGNKVILVWHPGDCTMQKRGKNG